MLLPGAISVKEGHNKGIGVELLDSHRMRCVLRLWDGALLGDAATNWVLGQAMRDAPCVQQTRRDARRTLCNAPSVTYASQQKRQI